jgi:hypothetical protein
MFLGFWRVVPFFGLYLRPIKITVVVTTLNDSTKIIGNYIFFTNFNFSQLFTITSQQKNH